MKFSVILLLAFSMLSSYPVMATAPVIATTKESFTLSEMARLAKAYEQKLIRKVDKDKTDDLIAALAQIKFFENRGHRGQAINVLERLVGRYPDHQGLWVRLADAWGKKLEHSRNSQNKNAEAATYAAYLKARTRGQKIDALILLGRLLKGSLEQQKDELTRINSRVKRIKFEKYQQSRGDSNVKRSFLQKQLSKALNEHLNIAETFTVALNNAEAVYAELDRLLVEAGSEARSKDIKKSRLKGLLLNQYGDPLFYADTDISQEATDKSASLCFSFSLPLKADPASYNDFFTLKSLSKGASPANLHRPELIVKSDKLCAQGLDHGKKYQLTLKKGLPSATGFKLQKDITREVVVKNRPSSMAFRSTAFILPRAGPKTIPLYTINMDMTELELVRISDRNINLKIALGTTSSQASYKAVVDEMSQTIWSGKFAIKSKLNKRITNHLPVSVLLDSHEEWMASRKTVAGTRRSSRGAPKDLALGNGIFATGRFHDDHTLSGNNRPLKGWEPGVYALHASPPSHKDVACSYNCTTTQWFVITDIGLTFYQSPEKLYVIARSLKSGEKLTGINIQLLASNNRILENRNTDANGVATFAGGLARGQNGNALAAILATHELREDFAFVDFTNDTFDLSDHGISGRKWPKFLDAYLYTDRGIYRPLENINTTLIIRDAHARTLKLSMPLNIKMRSASGHVISEDRLDPATLKMGGTTFSIKIPANAPFGATDIEVYPGDSDERIGFTTVQIGHVRPDRVRLAFSEPETWQKSLSKTGEINIKGQATGQYLYGLSGTTKKIKDAAASHLETQIELLIKSSASPFDACYEDYRFGDEEERFSPRLSRHNGNRTDQHGVLDFDLHLSRQRVLTLPLQARLSLTLLDSSGSVASRTTTLALQSDRNWIGVKQSSQENYTSDGKMRVHFDILTLDKNNQVRAAQNLNYRIFKERDYFIWQKLNENWEFQGDVARDMVLSGSVEALPKLTRRTRRCKRPNRKIDAHLSLGRYFLEVTDKQGVKTTKRFQVGWSSAKSKSPTPDKLTALLDRQEYTPGQTATLSLSAPFEGSVLVAIIDGTRVVDWLHGATTKQIANLSFKIPKVWNGRALYAVATAFRRDADGSFKRGPARALGIVHFTVNRNVHRLVVNLDGTPFKITPRSKLNIRLNAQDMQGKPFTGDAYASLYAVDEGLLSLTRHQPPSLYHHFYGQRRLGLDILDSYNRILVSEKDIGNKSGGDGARLRSSQLYLGNYLSEQIISRFQKPVLVSFKKGVAQIPFAFAGSGFNFNGALQLGVLVWNREKLGVATQTIVVRETIVAKLGLPRFLSPDDRSKISFSIENLEAKSAKYQIELTPSGPLELGDIRASDGTIVGEDGESSFTVKLPRGARKLFTVDLAVDQKTRRRKGKVNISIAGLNGNPVRISKWRSISIRRTVAPLVKVASLELAAGKKRALDATLIPDSLRALYKKFKVQLRVTRGPVLVAQRQNRTRILSLERTIWKSLIGFNRKLKSGEKAIAVQDIRNIEALQTSDGNFLSFKTRSIKLDGESDSDGKISLQDGVWRTALALDFLNLAQSKGLKVTPSVLVAGNAYLKEKLDNALRNANPQWGEKYFVDKGALCTPQLLSGVSVLSRIGEISWPSLNHIQKLCANVLSPLSRAVLAAAVNNFGKTKEVKLILSSFNPAGKKFRNEEKLIDQRQYAAMTLAFLVQAKASPKLLKQALQDVYGPQKSDRDISLATRSWLSRARTAGPLPSHNFGKKISIRLKPTQPLLQDSATEIRTDFLTEKDFLGQKMTITNKGRKPMVVSLVFRGIPKRQSSSRKVFDIKRTLFDANGIELDKEAPTVKRNQVVFVILSGKRTDKLAQSKDHASDHLLVVDMLPSGFEIISTQILDSLKNRQDLEDTELTNLDFEGKVETVEARDDRYVAIIRPQPEKGDKGKIVRSAFVIGYAMRATTAGSFILPPLSVEDHLRPELSAHTSSARISITEP